MRRRHLAALIGAAPASLGALTAMVHLAVLRAFLGARLADRCTAFADIAGALTAARHICSRQAANLCAIDIQRNAARHALHIRFTEAGGSAMAAGFRTGIAGIDAGLKL